MNEVTIQPEQVGQIEQKSQLQIIEERLNQSSSSRLAEFITGFRLEDPQLIEKLIEDHMPIRQKYGLQSLDLLWEEPAEYERQLRQDAQKLGVTIREVSDCGAFFEDYSARGVFMEESKTIGATLRRDVSKQYSVDLKTLEHEFVHSQQHKDAPRMPVEMQEYEAYVANISTQMLEERPQDALDALFGFFILSSVSTWYKSENSKRKEGDPILKPVWEDPRYFLKNVDQISDEDILRLIDQIKADDATPNDPHRSDEVPEVLVK